MARIRDASGIHESTEVNNNKDMAPMETTQAADIDPKEKGEKVNEEVEMSNPTREEKETEEEEETEDDGNDDEQEEAEKTDEGAGKQNEENLESHENVIQDTQRVEESNEDESSEKEGSEAVEAEKVDEEKIQDSSDDDDDSQPLQPEKMYFGPTEYNKACKIGTRCSVRQTVEYLEEFQAELKWFRNHDQFKHIFHMPKEPNHMIQGMWMLILRTACTEMERECWFVVNGVPIRYSMREHALLTGFDCHEYPNNWKELGDLKFVKRVFGRCDTIKVKDVEDKLEGMKSKSSLDRKKMAILYFLCKVVKAKSKADGNIDSFLLRVVDDVKACETFPWGRYTFNDCMEGIRGVMKNMKGSVKPRAQTGFSGFIVPLEILAFECIPHLGSKFRVGASALKACPRMCKHKFSEACMKGFPLEDINEALGSTNDIHSILEPDSDEKSLLARIIDDDVDDGVGFVDPIVDSWRDRLIVKKKSIWWKDMYELDLGSRSVCLNVDEIPENVDEILLKEVMEKGFEHIIEKLAAMDNKISLLDVRVSDLENIVTEQLEKEEADFQSRDFQPSDVQPSDIEPSDLQPRDVEPSDVQQRYVQPNDVQPSENFIGVPDPITPNMEEIDGEDKKNDTEKKKDTKKKKDKGKNKDVGTPLETGVKRIRKPSRMVKTLYEAEQKRQKRK